MPKLLSFTRIMPAIFGLMLFSTAAAATGLVFYGKEIDAVKGCNGGGVVWIDKTTGEYVYKGSPYYGKAGNAAYVCEMDALRNGGHAHQGK